MSTPVCKRCNDTHKTPAPEDESGPFGDGMWMCTSCPTPCRRCAGGGGCGAYCVTTPCACDCHRPRALSRSEGERVRARHAVERMRATLEAALIAIDGGDPIDPASVQAVAHTAIDLAMAMTRIDAYARAEATRG